MAAIPAGTAEEPSDGEGAETINYGGSQTGFHGAQGSVEVGVVLGGKASWVLPTEGPGLLLLAFCVTPV